MNRPIVYAIAVIIAGFLPIYALTGPSAKLFRPMADTTIFALDRLARRHADAGARALRVGLRRGVASGATRRSSGFATSMRAGSTGACAHPSRDGRRVARAVRASSLVHRVTRRRVHAEARRGRAVGARDDAVHDLVRGVVEDRPAGARDPASFPEVTVVASEHGRDDAGTDPDRILQRRVLRRTQAVWRVERRVSRPRTQLIDAIQQEARGVSGHHVQLHAAGRGCGRRGGDGTQERRSTSRSSAPTSPCSSRRDARSRRSSSRVAGHRGRHARPGARSAEPHDHGRSREDRAIRR